MSPQLKDQEHDITVLGQSYPTASGGGYIWVRNNDGMMNRKGKPKKLGKTLLQRHSDQQASLIPVPVNVHHTDQIYRKKNQSILICI
jgi:hypothetical protein